MYLFTPVMRLAIYRIFNVFFVMGSGRISVSVYFICGKKSLNTKLYHDVLLAMFSLEAKPLYINIYMLARQWTLALFLRHSVLHVGLDNPASRSIMISSKLGQWMNVFKPAEINIMIQERGFEIVLPNLSLKMSFVLFLALISQMF